MRNARAVHQGSVHTRPAPVEVVLAAILEEVHRLARRGDLPRLTRALRVLRGDDGDR